MSEDRQPRSATITLDTDEIGIWLMDNTPEDRQRLGLVTWEEIAKYVRQNIQQAEYIESMGFGEQ